MTARLARHLLIASLAAGAQAQAQAPVVPSLELPPLSLPLSDLTGFRAPSGSWRIAGGASADRSRALALATEPGTGVLVNLPASNTAAHLFTTREHGDLWLSFDVMLPKGSNSGVYLMGRYEVELADSWGVRTPTFADLGGIQQRWNESQKGFEGIAPRQNASRAPGLWQHVEILFRAPKFDGTRKVANARFDRVTVNGVVVQEMVEVTGPTRDAVFKDEVRSGPLVVQGDRGPLAVRNIQYRSYVGKVQLAALRYRAFTGESMDSAWAATHQPLRQGDATSISADHVPAPDRFAVSYDGTITLPVAGRYRFQLILPWIPTDSAPRGVAIGGGRLSIGSRQVLLHTGADRRAFADVDLPAGQQPFAFSFYRNRQASNRRDVALWVEGAGVERQALHEESAPFGAPPNPIIVEARDEPVVLRGFMRHRDSKRVIVAAVADPFGAHFSYDLAQGALLHAWRGPFLETTQMWHERGEDQIAEPLGSVITLPGTPALAFLPDANAAWPDSVGGEQQLSRKGYQLDASGRPTLLYQVRDVAVEDRIRSDSSGLSLQRDLHLRASGASASSGGLYLQLARGQHITRDRDGSYTVDDRSFYITLPRRSPEPVIRSQNGRDELVLPVRFDRGEARVSYSLVW